jgi:hypothetical protein
VQSLIYLFDLECPITISHSQFEEYWPLISTVYTKQNGTVEVQRYEGHLRKSKRNGKAPLPKTIDNGAIKKRHGRIVCDKGQCNVWIELQKLFHLQLPFNV